MPAGNWRLLTLFALPIFMLRQVWQSCWRLVTG